MVTVYVLRLAGNKYYVGKTSRDVDDRVQEHIYGRGSAWTSLHKPCRLVETRTVSSLDEEDRIVKDYMRRYGVSNVRGGSYSQVNLDTSTIRFLQREISTMVDGCFRCGRIGHTVKQCFARAHYDGSALGDCSQRGTKRSDVASEVWVCEYCEREFQYKSDATNHERVCWERVKNTFRCSRCGRLGHRVVDCYAITTVYGSFLYDLH